MANRKRLEQKLRIIQDLKADKYVGTQEALRYITRVSALYDNPVRVSLAINHRLRQQLNSPRLHYEATPEIVVGLCRTIVQISDDASHAEHDAMEKEGDADQLREFLYEKSSERIEKNPIGNYISLLAGAKYGFDGESTTAKHVPPRPKVLTEQLIPIFTDVQSPETDDITIGVHATQVFLDDVQPTEFQREYIQRIISSVDWSTAFSKDSLRDFQSFAKSEIYISEIDLAKRIKRIERDQVDNRLEHRRGILTEWLTTSGINSYDDARASLNMAMTNARKLRKRLQGLRAPQVFLEHIQDRINRTEFLAKALAPERNFLTKFLAN